MPLEGFIRMDAITNLAVNQTAMASRKSRVAALENALLRMAQPGFGICETCGNAIEAKRLMVMPEATACVACVRAAKQ